MRVRTNRRNRRRPPLGQHFLADTRVRGRILERLNLKPTDCWLEIGPGHGEMTLALAEASRALVAVERDARLVPGLREKLRPFTPARVLEADVLQVSLEEVARELGCARLRVYGNLPYYITSPILQRLFAAAGVLEDIHVVVQREVAQRLAARPRSRDYGFLSVLAQFHTQPEILLEISRGAFRPPPKVDSGLVRLAPPGEKAKLRLANEEGFLRFVGQCFRHKRKTLRNNLRSSYSSPHVERALAESSLSARARAEELSLREFAVLYELLTLEQTD